MEKTVYKITMQTDKDGSVIYEYTQRFQEKEKAYYVVDNTLNPFARRIMKTEMYQIKESKQNNHSNISFYVYCLPEDVVEWRGKLNSTLEKEVTKYVNETSWLHNRKLNERDAKWFAEYILNESHNKIDDILWLISEMSQDGQRKLLEHICELKQDFNEYQKELSDE